MKQNYEKKLFNTNATDENTKMIGSDITNILNLARVKYPQFLKYVDIAYQNNWHFAKTDMSNDKKQYYNVLTDEEREAFDNVISFLIFLDSIQTNNLPNISDYITLPEVVYFLARQTWDEALHSRSYGHILANGVEPEDIDKITYKWRENEILKNRVEYITAKYQGAKDNHSFKNFVSAIVSNYLLEGLYFFNGFNFFHNLASRGLMIGTDTQIRYIQRDENIHCIAFKDIINITREENADLWTEEIDEMIYDLFRDAVELEKAFSIDVLGDKILGINIKSITNYTNYLANKRLKDIGMDEIFENSQNPYKHLDKIASVDDETSNRSNQFEVTSITYKSPEIIDGWDDL